MLTGLEQAVERADLDPGVSVLLLSGNGKGFCGGYDLVQSAEHAEGFAFQGLAAREGFRAAVRDRDQDFGDLGPSTFKG
jgi:enoyl-CoA hydratase/carnithine racemase